MMMMIITLVIVKGDELWTSSKAVSKREWREFECRDAGPFWQSQLPRTGTIVFEEDSWIIDLEGGCIGKGAGGRKEMRRNKRGDRRGGRVGKR